MKKILLTGATGYLGSALARYWVRAGHQVSALIRPLSSRTRIQDVVSDLQLYSCVDDEHVLAAVAKARPDYIVHTACSYGRSGESLLTVFDTNLRFGLLLLEAAKSLDKEVTFLNTGTVLDPAVSIYAMSKQFFSEVGASQAEQGIKFVNVALQHMYGPGDDKSKFTSYVINSCLSNVERLALASGVQKRDFIFIDDVVSAYDAILSNMPGIANFERIEVGSGLAVPVRRFVELVHRMAASRTQLEFGVVPYRHNEAMLFQADISQMRSLGWGPATSLEVGLQKTIDKDRMQ